MPVCAPARDVFVSSFRLLYVQARFSLLLDHPETVTSYFFNPTRIKVILRLRWEEVSEMKRVTLMLLVFDLGCFSSVGQKPEGIVLQLTDALPCCVLFTLASATRLSS